tara:strand:+ start:582 stop:2426 length:1845 start_codon:yes stop_codon:yes gene_type:complete
MIMVPPAIDNTNFAEKKVFSKLKYSPNPETKNWIVYHSLNYPVSIKKTEKKSYKYFGEADFVILIPNKGIINIEVKGWTGFSCKKGVWDITKPDGTKEPNKKSPLKQARDSMFNIRKYIELKLNKKFPQIWMVVFTQCAFDLVDDDIEYSIDNIIDTDGFNSNFINRLINLSKILKTGGGVFQINENDLNILQKKIMRPNFEIFIKTPTILSDSEIEINEFTDEQIDILNHLDEGKRILITGSQGTGKTSIAEDILKREYEKNKSKILFLNSNRLASEEMKDKLKNSEPETHIDCFTFNSFLLKIINSVDQQISKSIFKLDFLEKNNFLINKSIELLIADRNLAEKFKYDFIVFDEMQNCFFFEKFYDFMELILKDGLSNGKYCFLGDFKYQNLVSDQFLIDQNKHPKNYLIDYEQVPLTRNVRNSKSISRNAPILSGLFKTLPYQISKSEHGEVINSFCKDRSEKVLRVETILRKLKNEGVKGQDIVILSNFRLDNQYNFISDLNISDQYNHIVDLTDRNIRNLSKNIEDIKKKECIYFSTASAFQGLESKIVIYVDPLETPSRSYEITDSLKTELVAFNAMGRATTILYLVWDIRLKEYYDKQLKVIGELTV